MRLNKIVSEKVSQMNKMNAQLSEQSAQIKEKPIR